MSRGRLSLDDRRTIAAGLADGLGYAEIARRIGRPTSTVSREVARNGHRDYRAEHAQEAARPAARRRPPAPRGAAEVDHARAFVEELAQALTATGMPRMAARVFAALTTAETDTTTAAELVRQLSVSPASVSKAIAYLESMELVERRTAPGVRKDLYRVGDDVWMRAIRADSSAHAAVAEAAQRGLDLVAAESPAGIRLARMGRFFGALTQQMSGSELADATFDDARTVIAALGYTRSPVPAPRLAGALGWPPARLDVTIRELRRQPALADPFSVQESHAGYLLQARPDRLSADRRTALDSLQAAPLTG